MTDLEQILDSLYLSKLYVEIYNKPTGFHSVEEMKQDIAIKMSKVDQLKQTEKREFVNETLSKFEKKFKREAMYYYCSKYPIIIQFLNDDMKEYLKSSNSRITVSKTVDVGASPASYANIADLAQR